RHEDAERASGLGGLFLLEEPAYHRDVAEDRDLTYGVAREVLGDAADDEPVALLDQDLSLRFALVDDRDADADAKGDGISARVVLHHHEHLDLVDDLVAHLFPEHARQDIELEHGLLELDLCPGRAHGCVPNLFDDRDAGLAI